MNRFLKIVCLFCFILILAFACTIPFYFESPSILYKFGTDKLLLRSGKIFGILAGVLMVFQVISATRFSFFEKLFGRVRVLQFHKFNGITLTLFAICHPFCILWADGFSFFPLQKRYWPEFLGIGLLLFLVTMTMIAYLYRQIKISWKEWFVSHRISAPLIFFGVFIHVNNVSKSFESGLPFLLLLTAFFTAMIVLVYKWAQGLH